MAIKILSFIFIMILITFFYKLLPFRVAGDKKPAFAIFPKYKKYIKHDLTNDELKDKLSEFGFKQTSKSYLVTKFTRGSVIGETMKSAKIDVDFKKIKPNEYEIFIRAGWMVAFDTGGHWKLITELSEEIENEMSLLS